MAFTTTAYWFSVQSASGQLSVAEQFTAAAERASDWGRKHIHQELLRLPEIRLPRRIGWEHVNGEANPFADAASRGEIESLYRMAAFLGILGVAFVYEIGRGGLEWD